MIQGMDKSVCKRVSISRAMQPDGICLAAFVHHGSAIAKRHQQDVQDSLVPVIRLVNEGEIASIDVQQGLYKRPFLDVVSEQSGQPQVHAAASERRSQSREQFLLPCS